MFAISSPDEFLFLPGDAIASAGTSCRLASVRPSVRLSVAGQCCTETAERRITRGASHDSQGR